MKFGSTDNPGNIDFTLPPDHSENQKVLQRCDDGKPLKIYVGCAKWNKADLKGFYPRGTKDELGYYSTQFESIEIYLTKVYEITLFEEEFAQYIKNKLISSFT